MKIKRAQNEGRVIFGPDSLKGAVYHWRDSTTQGALFENDINTKLSKINRYRQAAEDIKETQRQIAVHEAGNLDKGNMRSFLAGCLDIINKGDSGPGYRVVDLPGYSRLQTKLAQANEKVAV